MKILRMNFKVKQLKQCWWLKLAACFLFVSLCGFSAESSVKLGPMKGGEKAKKLSVDVSAIKSLSLKATGGSWGHAVWGEPVLTDKEGKQIKLTSLKPVSSKVGWSRLFINKAYDNKPLNVSGQQFSHGIFAHSDSELVYQLDGKYTRFECWVGLNHTCGKRGKVTFSVGDLELREFLSAKNELAGYTSLADDVGFSDEVATFIREAELLEKGISAGGSTLKGQLSQWNSRFVKLRFSLQQAFFESNGIEKLLLLERHDIKASHIYTLNVEAFRAGGGLSIYDVKSGEVHKLINSPDGEIMNADLSFDGKKVVFAWRRNWTDSYHIYTVNVDGTNLEQVTKGEFADHDPCWLPDGGIAFISSRVQTFPFCWTSPGTALYRCEADGSKIKRLSYSMLADLTPSVMADGRIIYTRWEYIDRNGIPIQSLWTIRPDGTGLLGYFGNRVLDPGTFAHARQIPGSNKVVCTMAGHNGPLRGAIGVLDITKGGHSQEAIHNVTKELNIGKVDKGDGNILWGKPYLEPVPVNEKFFICSKLGQLQLRDYSGDFFMDLPVKSKIGYYCAIPLKVRTRPPILPSQLPQDSNESQWATLLVQDVYNGLEPAVKRGEITHLMIVEEGTKPIRSENTYQLNAPRLAWRGPVISCGAAYSTKTILGVVPVEKDGSAYFKVPARRPVYFLALDKYGQTIQRMRTFTQFQEGEVQSCVGCHADRNYATPNSAGGRPLATLKTVSVPKLPDWGAASFSYPKLVQPVLDRACISCHNPRKKSAGLDLTGDRTEIFNVSYDHLARDKDQNGTNPYTSWIPTLNGREWAVRQVAPRRWGSPKSKLAKLVLDGHPDINGKARVKLTDDERRRILYWIDLNVPYYGTLESSHPKNAGMRYLSRPKKLQQVIQEVAKRRGVKLPKRQWNRIANPENSFMLCDNLAKSAGGSAADDKAVFKSKDDPDYQKILKAWKPWLEELEKWPRIDMPGGKPAVNCNRSSN